MSFPPLQQKKKKTLRAEKYHHVESFQDQESLSFAHDIWASSP